MKAHYTDVDQRSIIFSYHRKNIPFIFYQLVVPTYLRTL